MPLKSDEYVGVLINVASLSLLVKSNQVAPDVGYDVLIPESK